MDVTVPSHNIRSLSLAVGCLGRISKDLYIEFSALEGLILRTLNDSKSAFASFEFAPSFFERCTTPLDRGSMKKRKLQRKPGGIGRQSRRRNRRSRNEEINEEKEGEEEELDDKYTCRVPIRIVHSILRSRKGVISLRIRSCMNKVNTDVTRRDLDNFIVSDMNERAMEDGYSMQLSFEFLCETIGPMRVTRRIGVEECDGIAANVSKLECSEIHSSPKTLSGMLDPLYRTTEVALCVNDVEKIVTATSFHATSSSDNALLASRSILNTETTIKCDDFLKYAWRDDHVVLDTNEQTSSVPPPNVNEEVTLVFSIKELKAMLQFCSQVGADIKEYLDVFIFFQWAGKPIIFETETESFLAYIILATLDDALITPIGNK